MVPQKAYHIPDTTRRLSVLLDKLLTSGLQYCKITNKERKVAQNEKSGKKSKEEGASALLRRLTEEVARLREDIDGIRTAGSNREPGSENTVSFSYSTAAGDRGGSSKPILREALTALDNPESLPGILAAADDARVARLGYALSSGPKVVLMRILLEEGGQTAAYLGGKTGLSTGSLYHHLRELIHAEAVHQEERNHYALTQTGRRAALLLFTLASLKI